MKDLIKKRCDLFAENRYAMGKAFIFEYGLIKVAASSAFTQNGREVDAEYVKGCQKILQKEENYFSYFRGFNEVIVSSKMAVSGQPEKYLEDAVAVYDKLKEGKLMGSIYRAVAAMVICDSKRMGDADVIVDRTSQIMKGMKEKHPFLTTDEDTCFAVLLAMSDKNVDDILTELEDSYQILKKKFLFHDNDVYSLAQVITALGGSSEEKCEKALNLYDAFKAAGAPYGKNYELSMLGCLVDLDVDQEQLIQDVVEAEVYLRSQKGLGVLDMSKETRLMYASMITAAIYNEEKNPASSAIENTIAVTIAQEVTFMLIVVMCSSIASISSN